MAYLVNGHTVRSAAEARTALTIARATGGAHAVRQAEAVLCRFTTAYFTERA